MINVEERYFSLNRTLLLVVGLWPYENSKFSRIQYICFFSILISCIMFQITILMTSECTVDFVIKVFSFLLVYIMFVIHYNSFNVNAETVKYIMEQLQHVYENLKDYHEIAIIEKYGESAKRFTGATAMLIVSSIFTIIIAQLWQDFLHIILSVNQSRSNRMLILIEYVVDQEEYFYLLSFYTITVFSIGITTILATDSLLLSYLLHICGLFRIASYRIANSMQIYTVRSINPSSNNKVNKNIACAVDIHRKATTFSKLIAARFEITFIFLVAAVVICLSINMFCLVTYTDNIEQFLIFFISACSCLSAMFVTSVIGQEIIDHNNHIFDTTYEIQWYIAPIHIQKLILFLLQHGKKLFGLRAGLLIASLQCFTTVANASLSYFTVMYSTQ